MEDDPLLTADEAAELLGVRRQTIYAYVSRGQLQRHSEPGTRQSRFRQSDLDAMAKGDRARQPGRSSPSNRTAVTSIVGGRLLYRERDAVDIAGALSFEQAAEWLWRAHEGAAPAWRPSARPGSEAPALPLPDQCLPLDRLKIAAAGLGAVDPLRYDLSPHAVLAVARSLLPALVLALPAQSDGAPPPAADAGFAAALWPRLTASAAGDDRARLLDQALILSADHGLAPSTRAVRTAASVAADPYSVALTGMSVASGLRHGGSSLGVHSLLTDIGRPDRVEAVVSDHLRRGAALPGFGQPRYEGPDPRAGFLLGRLLGDRDADPDRLAAVREVVALVRERNDEHPSIEFALGALCFLHDMVRGAGEAVFVLARCVGWIAHALEEYTDDAH
ncbi:citrate/2-methylcitrate synthase [Nocardiopsis mangrovi]|uniref:citrate synthase (unknown stereospecificity) n=1 Tax=Nocardiopsis mangrovi TaxID=1179818 RepID=A0ABV9DW54_9ACTN